jgi:enoyl-CoA hydratase
MSDLDIRRRGHAGRITLTRPKALNALTYGMCLDIEAALDAWAIDAAIQLIVVDAEGDRAFCAGGDIVEMYETGMSGDYAYGRQFWRDEYRLNAKIANYPKPIVTLMQGFTMGGGVGIGCHASHRIVGETSRIAMPEVGIGLIPDVGGSLLLARGPGHLGEYLGTTAARMGPGDAIFAGFADTFVTEDRWPALIADLEETGAPEVIRGFAASAPDSPLATRQDQIDRHFAAPDLAAIARSLDTDTSDFATHAAKALSRASPLSAAAALDIIRHAREIDTIEAALAMEYRFTYRSAELGDFLEGIRAAVIDKDRTPHWKHARPEDVSDEDVVAMLASLGPDELDLTA